MVYFILKSDIYASRNKLREHSLLKSDAASNYHPYALFTKKIVVFNALKCITTFNFFF